ncbi:MAG: MBL fold metallo-hydrolase [Prevotella sp.]|nr:MBL fold metallo-hydrolase [Prevotella sp.]MCM1474739.1 MBL fold metallo-hydrolase [Muribaculaceae bacterium]
MKVTVLGSGTSKGIPEAGCGCEVCRSSNSHDKRFRASVLVQTMGLNIMIDASPDFREQALRHGIRRIDAVLITHSHYDHVGGIDDLRPYCAFGDVTLYVRRDVDGDLRRRLDYCFREHLYPGVPKFEMQIIDNAPFMIRGVEITPVEVLHGKLPIFGYRIGNFGYITDCKTINEEEKDKLIGLDVLIINALRDREHFSHLTISEALALIKELTPKRAYLTHMSHHAGKHAELDARLPENVHPLYDGQVIKI